MPVRFQIASDLHLENLQYRAPTARLLEPALGADALILAGDIGNGLLALERFKNWPVPVFYVAGNHEHYGWDLKANVDQLRRAAAPLPRFHFLERDAHVFKGVRLLGCTLWTDYALRSGLARSSQMAACARSIADHFEILYEGRQFHPEQAYAEHLQARKWLHEQLSTPFAGKTLVISHHAPHPLSVAPKYVGNPINAGFVSNLSELLVKADYWVHGHTHDGFDYRVGGCRVLANPRGYCLTPQALELGKAALFENPFFNPELLLEV